jgi:phosphoribosylformimino-5-aminoimidazole carboxamide ribotide isomerase
MQLKAMPEFEIIPVLDLKGGSVVHGKAGKRETYRPIVSPFGPADAPLKIARGLLEAAEASILYIADLDAIAGQGDHAALIASLAVALPETEIWLDAGLADVESAYHWRAQGVTPVIGSESLASVAQWQALGRQADFDKADLDPVLSLDFDGETFRGPEGLRDDPDLWPRRVIIMTLARVGSGSGPDIARLQALRASGGEERRYYAAGGARNIQDLDVLAEAGAAGVAIATALHRGLLPKKEIAAFRRRRRLPIEPAKP